MGKRNMMKDGNKEKESKQDTKERKAEGRRPLTFRQSSIVESRAAVYIQSALAEIGVTVEIEALPDAEFTQRTSARDLELYMNNFLGWGADPFYQMRSLVGTGAGTNFNNYANEDLTALLPGGELSS